MLITNAEAPFPPSCLPFAPKCFMRRLRLSSMRVFLEVACLLAPSFEKCYLNRSSKYKVCVGAFLHPRPDMLPCCSVVPFMPPSPRAARNALSARCCYLRSNPAL